MDVGSHLTSDDILDYFEGALPDARGRQLDEHLADCYECVRRVRELIEWQELVTSWNGVAHGRASWSTRIADAVASAAAGRIDPAWRERLGRWSREAGGRIGGGLRLVMAAPGNGLRIAADALDSLAGPGPTWRFRTVSSASPVRGAGDSAESTIAVAVSENTPRMRIACSGDTGEIVVRLDEIRRRARSPLVLLIPESPGAPPIIREFERPAGVDYLVARFESVPAGAYALALEPML